MEQYNQLNNNNRARQIALLIALAVMLVLALVGCDEMSVAPQSPVLKNETGDSLIFQLRQFSIEQGNQYYRFNTDAENIRVEFDGQTNDDVARISVSACENGRSFYWVGFNGVQEINRHHTLFIKHGVTALYNLDFQGELFSEPISYLRYCNVRVYKISN